MKQHIKHAKRASVILLYGVTTAAIIVATIVLVAMAQGYRYDPATGEITSGGLVLTASEPAAELYLDNKPLNKSTPQRLLLRAGSYDLKMILAGYRDWQKRIDVESGEVTWVQYPYLLPDSIITQPVLTPQDLSVFEASPNRQWLVLAQNGSTPNVLLMRSSNQETRVIYSLPTDLVKQKARISGIAWAHDNERLLLTLSIGQAKRYIVISRANASETVDVGARFNKTFSSLRFNPRNSRELYGVSAQGLQQLNTANFTSSEVLLPGLTTYIPVEDVVYYLQTNKQSVALARLGRDGQTSILLKDLPLSSYSISSNRFDGRTYLTVLDTKNRYANIYLDEGATLKIVLEKIPAQSVSSNFNQRFIAFQDAQAFTAYDFEFQRVHRFELPQKALQSVTWFDDYHLLGTSGERLLMFEFDGGNAEEIVAAGAFKAFADPELRILYSIGRSSVDNKLVLQQSLLRP